MLLLSSTYQASSACPRQKMYQRSELDYLIYNVPLEYADLILNGDLEKYLKAVTQYKPIDS